MFDEVSTSKPWYRSWPVALIAVAAVIGAACLFLFFRWRTDPRSDAHYAALEQHRAQQRQQPGAPPPGAEAQQAPAAPPATAGANGEAAQGAAGAQAPGAGEAATAPPAAPPAPGTRRNYWTNFRGPGRDGRYDEAVLKTNWGAAGLPLLWRQPVGGGYASFVIADGAAYTIEQRRGQEVVAAYHIENGRELWTHGWNAEFRESTGDGPRATPTWDSGRLYALGATGELRCLDAKTGRPLWSKNILGDNGASNLQWGMAASPLIVDDKVVVLPGGTSGKSVVAYHKMTGAPVWKVLNDEASYTSPMLVTLGGRQQILVVTAQ
jgi:hypothetical protein